MGVIMGEIVQRTRIPPRFGASNSEAKAKSLYQCTSPAVPRIESSENKMVAPLAGGRCILGAGLDTFQPVVVVMQRVEACAEAELLGGVIFDAGFGIKP